ncbi:MAG: hypothetical protein GYA24_13050 [Candidatus Lokiarchaeota archaeon]|nr:hypothetical protein [Candidatus Lokiarchaeota archaeon]
MKEKLTPSLICSIGIILSGLLFVTASPPLTRTSIGDIQNYIVFFTIMIILFATALVITFLIKRTKNIFFALCSAFSYGLGATTQGVFAVNVLDISSLANISFYLSLLVEPLFYIMILFSIGGYVFGNLMAYKFKLSLTYSIQYPLSEMIVLIGSVVIFNEDLSFVTNPNRIIGILLLMAGLVVVVITQRKYLAPPIFVAKT